jgi:putative ABC transport system permease protein
MRSSAIARARKRWLKVAGIAGAVGKPARLAGRGLAYEPLLDGFAYRIDLELWVFVMATVSAIFVALITVATHCYLVARAKPAAALKTE